MRQRAVITPAPGEVSLPKRSPQLAKVHDLVRSASGIDQPRDALARRELAAAMDARDVLVAPAGGDLGASSGQRRVALAHGGEVAREGAIVESGGARSADRLD